MIPGSPSSDDSHCGGFNKLRRRKLSFRRRTEKGKFSVVHLWLGPFGFPICFQTCSASPKKFIQSRSSRTEEPVFPRLCPDDADAGEIKKSHKSVRRRQREAANNQKREEALKRQWEGHRSSVSSHSSGDEVLLLLPMFVLNSTIKSCVNVWDLCLLQGEESVMTRLALPTEMLQNPHAEAAPRKSNENTEGDGDPKTGNTCNALSGKVQQRRRTPISLQTHANAL